MFCSNPDILSIVNNPVIRLSQSTRQSTKMRNCTFELTETDDHGQAFHTLLEFLYFLVVLIGIPANVLVLFVYTNDFRVKHVSTVM